MSRVTSIKRVEGQRRQKADFEDFNETGIVDAMHVESNKNQGSFFVIIQTEEDESKMMGGDELAYLQDENPDELILINKNGKKAEIGEDCTLSTKIRLSRINGELQLSKVKERV